MFDDLKQQNNQAPMTPTPNMPPTMPSSQAGQPVSDMFADVDPVAQNQNPMVKPSAVQSGKIKPVSNTSYTPNQPAPLDPVMFTESSGNKLNRLIIILVVVLLVLAMGAGAYYMIVVKGKNNLTNNNNNANQNNNQEININTNENENINANVDEGMLLDSDTDGLTDQEEATYNTSPLSTDTDGDGLSDRDEVKTYKTDPLVMDTDNDGLADGEEIDPWKTDPLVADSDNDTYPDGTEVKNGYNPNGPGRLDAGTPTSTTTPDVVP